MASSDCATQPGRRSGLSCSTQQTGERVWPVRCSSVRAALTPSPHRARGGRAAAWRRGLRQPRQTWSSSSKMYSDCAISKRTAPCRCQEEPPRAAAGLPPGGGGARREARRARRRSTCESCSVSERANAAGQCASLASKEIGDRLCESRAREAPSQLSL